MLIVASVLRFGGKEVEPGLPVPEGHGMAPHILQAHLSRRTIVEGDREKQNEIRARFLAGKREAEKKAFAATMQKLEGEIAATKSDIQAVGDALRKAEQVQAELVKRKQAEEVQARARLAELSKQLAALMKVEAPLAPDAAAEAPTKKAPAKSVKAAPAADPVVPAPSGDVPQAAEPAVKAPRRTTKKAPAKG